MGTNQVFTGSILKFRHFDLSIEMDQCMHIGI